MKLQKNCFQDEEDRPSGSDVEVTIEGPIEIETIETEETTYD